MRRVVKPCEIDAFEALPCGVLIDADLALRIPGRRPLRRQRDALYAFISRKLRIGGSGKHGFSGTVPAAEIIVGSGGRLHTVQHALLPPDAGFFADTRAAGGIILYGIRGLRVSADGEIVLGLAAVVPRAVQRHLGGFFRVKARVVRVEGVGIYIVGIGGGVVCVLRKLLRFVLARLMGKPRQLLFAAVIGAVRQPLHRQKPVLIAISNIILAAERAFAVCVKAMVNARSVDGTAADGDVFCRNKRQLLCVQVVIDIIGVFFGCSFRTPEGVHRAVHDLNIDILHSRTIADSDAGTIFAISIRHLRAAFCGHGAVFNKDPQRSFSAGPSTSTDGGTPHAIAAGRHHAVRNANDAFAGIFRTITAADGCCERFGAQNIDLTVLNVNKVKGAIISAANAVVAGIIRASLADAAAVNHNLADRSAVAFGAEGIARYHGAVRDLQPFQLPLGRSFFDHINAVCDELGIPDGDAPAIAGADAICSGQLDLTVFNLYLSVIANLYSSSCLSVC